MALDTATFAEGILEGVLSGLLDDIVASSEHISHHTGLTPSEAGYESDLVLANTQEVVLPGFDMKTQKEPVGPNGEMRGGLLKGRYAETHTNKRGEHYAIIPINPDVQPGEFHKQDPLDAELFASANMLADKAGEAAAMQFLLGAGMQSDMVYKWQTQRFGGAQEQEDGSRVVFRTVSENSPTASWWYPPRKVVVGVNMAEVMEDIDRILGGG